METTKVFSDLLEAYVDPAVRIIALKGSTRSGKTWAAIQLLNEIARASKKPRLISVVSETLPHLKLGAITDFKRMLGEDNIWDENKWHDTDKKYSYKNGAIEFFSASAPGKVLGPARQVLYVNECINVDWDIVRQLAVRTSEKIILDYNPAYEFWIDTMYSTREDFRLIHSTYKDNDMLTPGQVREIEANEFLDPDWWKVYGLGQTGSKEGLVIRNWDIVARMIPRDQWKAAYIGIDWGWAAPSAVELVVLGPGGEVWIQEILYGTHLDNPDIAAAIIDAGYGVGEGAVECICDVAEGKSIKELNDMGVWASPSDRKDIELGLAIMNRYKKHYTEDSLNTISENRKYHYPTLPDGTRGTVPVKKFGHAKDAERYVFLNKLSQIEDGFDVSTSKGNYTDPRP